MTNKVADTRWIRERARDFWTSHIGGDATATDVMAAFTESELAAEREQCCKDVCSYCADGDVPERRMYSHPPKPFWVHTMIGFDDRTEDCNAGAIHERLGKSAIRARQEGS